MKRSELRKALSSTSDADLDKALMRLDEEDNRLWTSLDSESDRGMVLSASAYFECFLESCLRMYFLPCAETDQLLSPNGALGTASARLACCKALRILEDFQINTLRKIFQIRNKFAHDLMVDFEAQGISDKVSDLFALAYKHFDAKPLKKNPRNLFSVSCLVLALDMQRREISVFKYTEGYPDLLPNLVPTTDLRRTSRLGDR